MREFIIEALNSIKDKTNNFTTPEFEGFMCGGFSLHEFSFNGAPDSILFTVYQEVCNYMFNYELKNTIKQFCDGTHSDISKWNFTETPGEPEKLFKAISKLKMQ